MCDRSKDYDLLLEATRNGFQSLFKEHNEKFYYCTLILSDGATPFISAFSDEALQEAVKKSDGEYSAQDLKWSYADSPYCGYGFEEYFKEFDKHFNERISDISDDEYDEEIEYWLSVMERVMKTLKKEKIFNIGRDMRNMIINVEIMPPDDDSCLEITERLNTKTAYKKWYKENYGDEDDIVSEGFAERLSKMTLDEIVDSLDDISCSQRTACASDIKSIQACIRRKG